LNAIMNGIRSLKVFLKFGVDLKVVHITRLLIQFPVRVRSEC
jgi:hypothetical protein